MNTQPEHTAIPWDYMPPLGEGLPAVLSKHVNKGGNFYVAQCNNDPDARFIVRAVNCHEALLRQLKLAVHMWESDEWAVRGEWFKRSTAAIKKAEGA